MTKFRLETTSGKVLYRGSLGACRAFGAVLRFFRGALVIVDDGGLPYVEPIADPWA